MKVVRSIMEKTLMVLLSQASNVALRDSPQKKSWNIQDRVHTAIFSWKAVLVQTQTELPEETEFYKQPKMSVEGWKLFMFLKRTVMKTQKDGWPRPC